jgi:hypothetical protein
VVQRLLHGLQIGQRVGGIDESGDAAHWELDVIANDKSVDNLHSYQLTKQMGRNLFC